MSDPISDRELDALIAAEQAEYAAKDHGTEILAEKIAHPVELAYRGTKGPTKLRTVEIRKITRRDGEIGFSGFCELAGKPRTFKAANVVRLTDGKTGEVIAGDRAAEWLEDLATKA